MHGYHYGPGMRTSFEVALRVQGLNFFNLIENINKIEFFSIRIEMEKINIFFNIGFNNYYEMDIENFQ